VLWQVVVLGEVARLGAAFGHGTTELVCDLLGDVLVEPAGDGARE
jgi:ribosomal protein S27E